MKCVLRDEKMNLNVKFILSIINRIWGHDSGDVRNRGPNYNFNVLQIRSTCHSEYGVVQSNEQGIRF